MSYIDALRIDGTDYEIKDSKAIHRDEWLDIIYPIGSIYWNKTNSKNPSEYLGGEWKPIINRVLVAAGTQFPINTRGGSANAVVVRHNHTQKSHNHTQTPHTHGQEAHTHAQYPHTHIQNTHYHRVSHNHYAQTGSFLTSSSNIAIHGTKRAWPAASSNGVRYVYAASNDGGIDENSATSTTAAWSDPSAGTNQNATASNYYTTAVNKTVEAFNNSTTAQNEMAGEDGNGKNMPPYVTAYCWERIG